ncbi:hypothetical protein BASA81_001415 [Batrachochytrium salamandrivorans]|nr:hypothetical protein BASA81_001415 [Batrachochytrium salamandrivorans]
MDPAVVELVEENRLAEAVQLLENSPERTSEEEIWGFAFFQLSKSRFDRASAFLRAVWDLLSVEAMEKYLGKFTMVLLTNNQLTLAVQWSTMVIQLGPRYRPSPVDCITYAVEKFSVDVALNAIANFKLERQFNLSKLVYLLVQQDNPRAAQKWSVRFGLEAEFPTDELCERMLLLKQWDDYLAVKQLTNLKRLPVDFIKRVILARDWYSVTKYMASQQGNTPEQQGLLLFMVLEMVRDGKFVMAIKQVFANGFLQTVPGVSPNEIVRRMVKVGDPAALRMMQVLGLHSEDVGGQDLVDGLHRQREQDLRQFRDLVKLRAKRRGKAAVPTRGPAMIVTASEVLGTHVCVQTRPVLRAMTIQGLYDKLAIKAADADDEEEILFVAQPKQVSRFQPSVSSPSPVPPQQYSETATTTTSSRFQQQMDLVFKPQPVLVATPKAHAPFAQQQQYQAPAARLAPQQNQSAVSTKPSAASSAPKKQSFLTPSQLF